MKRVSLSVGIPAYNEQANISVIIKSILRQNQASFKLEKIYVVCDGCIDSTAGIVQELAKKHREIQLIERKKRAGKVGALDKIYDTNRSEYILTVDADLAFIGTNDFEEMIKVIKSDSTINFVGPRHIPVKPNTMMGMFAYYSYLSFEDSTLR